LNIFRNNRALIVLTAVFIGALCRLIPHPPNFTPILSIAIIGGMYSRSLSFAILSTLGAMIVSDLFLGLHSLVPLTYGTLALIAWLSRQTNNGRFSSALRMSAIGPVIFFITSNFAVWLSSSFYPKTLLGLLYCFEAALPFFQNSLLSTAIYTSLLYLGIHFCSSIAPLHTNENTSNITSAS